MCLKSIILLVFMNDNTSTYGSPLNLKIVDDMLVYCYVIVEIYMKERCREFFP